MTYRFITVILVCLSFIFACSHQCDEATMKEQLIEIVISHPEVKLLNSFGKIIVIRSNNCNGMNCKTYFQNMIIKFKFVPKKIYS